MPDELEQLYRLRFHDFLRIARAITHDDAHAHDAVQETFARALRGRATQTIDTSDGLVLVGVPAESGVFRLRGWMRKARR